MRTGDDVSNYYVTYPSMYPIHRDQGYARIAAAAPIVRQFAPWPGSPDMVTEYYPDNMLVPPGPKTRGASKARVNSVSAANIAIRDALIGCNWTSAFISSCPCARPFPRRGKYAYTRYIFLAPDHTISNDQTILSKRRSGGVSG
jgi:hypothetical protein